MQMRLLIHCFWLLAIVSIYSDLNSTIRLATSPHGSPRGRGIALRRSIQTPTRARRWPGLGSLHLFFQICTKSGLWRVMLEIHGQAKQLCVNDSTCCIELPFDTMNSFWTHKNKIETAKETCATVHALAPVPQRGYKVLPHTKGEGSGALCRKSPPIAGLRCTASTDLKVRYHRRTQQGPYSDGGKTAPL